MLNLITSYQEPKEVSRVSGIPSDWSRSVYNVKAKAPVAFRELVDSLDAKYLLVSFNNEGFIDPTTMMEILSETGRVELVEIPYTVFRGCRNLRGRSATVTEQLFVVERDRTVSR